MKKKEVKFKVSYAAIADVVEEVKASSFEEALKKIRQGKGEVISCDFAEILDGTSYAVSHKVKTSAMTHYYSNSGELEAVGLEEELNES
jgi:hypothetical protein